MPYHKIQLNKRFGRLITIEYIAGDHYTACRYLCKCDCGKTKSVSYKKLKNGNTQSCGCLRKILHTTHDKHSSRSYKIYWGMIQRTTNPDNYSYKYYGARGIKVSPSWDTFEAFYADMGDPPLDHSIDRIDPRKDYFKENCKWSPRKVQDRSRTNNRWLTYNGETKIMTDWAKHFNIPDHVFRSRIKLGWSIQEAGTTRVNRYKKRSL